MNLFIGNPIFEPSVYNPENLGLPIFKRQLKGFWGENVFLLSSSQISWETWVGKGSSTPYSLLLEISLWFPASGSVTYLGGGQVLRPVRITSLVTRYYWFYEWVADKGWGSLISSVVEGNCLNFEGQNHAHDHFRVGLTCSRQFWDSFFQEQSQ